jgi:peptide-methionine (S)-S-oxide reductase
MRSNDKLEIATFGGGCFWCTEAVFRELRGVAEVACGYAGGVSSDPTYEQVCSGLSGHVEVIQIEFEPKAISFEVLLRVFFLTHDPTTLNRQGADVGEQYRSVVFFHGEDQRETSARIMAELDSTGEYASPIVTALEPAPQFHRAESSHQDYFARNPSQGYCCAVIPPKLQKLRATYRDQLRD